MKSTKEKAREKTFRVKKTENKENSGGSSSYRRLTLSGIILALFGLLYVPSLINWLSGNNVTLDIIRNGTIEEIVSAKGVIVRNEELLEPSLFEGRLIPEIGEGEKTAANSVIASVMSDASESLLQEVENINAKIVKARMEKAEKADFFSSDIAKLDGEIGQNVQKLIAACNGRSFREIRLYRTEITRIVEKKAEILGDDAADAYIESLLKQKKDLEYRINMNMDEIVSKKSGIVSYAIDGYEGVLTPESISSLTPAEIEAILGKEVYADTGVNRAYAGKPAAKIIKGTDIYIVAVVDEKDMEQFEEGKSINVRISEKEFETSATVKAVGPAENGKALVTVVAGRGVDILSDVRYVNVDFVFSTEEGLKVPLKCLMDISPDGTTATIMLVKSNVSTIREVEILAKDNEYAIITTPDKTVNLYDTYIINPQNVEEGVIIDK